MSGLGIVVMAVICGIVWGGFALLLARALRREAVKSKSGDGGA